MSARCIILHNIILYLSTSRILHWILRTCYQHGTTTWLTQYTHATTSGNALWSEGFVPYSSLPDTREGWTKTLHSHILIPGYNYLKRERIGNPIHELHHLGVCTPHKQENGTFGWHYATAHQSPDWISREWESLNDNDTLRYIPPGSGKWTLCKTILTMNRQTVISIHSNTSIFRKQVWFCGFWM